MSVKAPFTLRVRDNTGIKRVMFEDGAKVTFSELQHEIEVQCGVPSKEQKISRKAPPAMDLLGCSGSTLLSALQLKHGDMQYLCNTASVAPMVQSASTQSVATVALTKYCNHGPTGRCSHCTSSTPSTSTPSTPKCSHGPGVVCIHCGIDKTKDVNATAAWLCNHPSSAFCPKCIPTKPGAAEEAKKNPFESLGKYLADLASQCKNRHDDSTKCVMCAPPPNPTYSAKKQCDRGHPPYPYGSCTKCSAPNAVLKLQSWRAVDCVSQPGACIKNCYRQWSTENHRNVHRAWIIFGKVIDDVEDTELAHARKAQGVCVYEPVQTKYKDHVDIDLQSADFLSFCQVMGVMQLQPVGVLVCRNQLPNDPKYGGQAVVTAHEVMMLAQLQSKYSQALPNCRFTYSDFSLVVVEHGETVEPRSFQVSNQAVALVQEGLITPAEDPLLLKPTGKPQTGSVLYLDKTLAPKDSFVPDPLLVTSRTVESKQHHLLFAHCSFPNPRDADNVAIRLFLSTHAKEPWVRKISDANLLAAIQKFITPVVFQQVCEGIADQALHPDVASELVVQLYEHKLVDL